MLFPLESVTEYTLEFGTDTFGNSPAFVAFGNPKYAPSPLLINMVTSGDLGVKSGRGFYDYSHGTKDLVVAPNFA